MNPKFWTVYSGKYTKKIIWFLWLLNIMICIYFKYRSDSIKEQDVLLANAPKHS